MLLLERKENKYRKEINRLVWNHRIASADARLMGEKKERTRIYEVLHDRIGSYLTVLKWSVESYKESGLVQKDKTNSIQSTLRLIDKTHDDVLSVAKDLDRNRFDWISEIKEFCDEISKVKSKEVNVYTYGIQKNITGKIIGVAYDVIVQLIANVLEHAKATEININIDQIGDKELSILVEDNGKGFCLISALEASKSERGHGIKNIKKRIHKLNGTVDFDSTVGKGTTVSIIIPI